MICYDILSKKFRVQSGVNFHGTKVELNDAVHLRYLRCLNRRGSALGTHSAVLGDQHIID